MRQLSMSDPPAIRALDYVEVDGDQGVVYTTSEELKQACVALLSLEGKLTAVASNRVRRFSGKPGKALQAIHSDITKLRKQVFG